MIKTVGILGYGSFGQFLHTLAKTYIPDVQVKIWDRKHEPDTSTFFSFEEVCACDVVIFAVSISALEEIIQRAVPFVRDDAILVDIATVKTHPVSLFQKYASKKKYISTHPMFGPYSFEKKGNSLDGLRLVISEHTLNDAELAAVTNMLERVGLKILSIQADAHDRMLAETLFLTHYIGQVVARAGFVRTDVDTVSFGFLMDAVESVKHDTKLFEEVYRFNSYCKKVIERFEEGEHTVRRLIA